MQLAGVILTRLSSNSIKKSICTRTVLLSEDLGVIEMVHKLLVKLKAHAIGAIHGSTGPM